MLSMRWENCKIRPQVDQDIERQFTSGDVDLDDFWKNDSLNYSHQRLSANYIVESSDTILAYYAIANDRVSVDDFPSRSSFNRFRSRFVYTKRLRGYPAVKLCRLAVSENAKGNGIGSDIIKFLKYNLYQNSIASCRFLIVDAYADAVDFYLKNGFSQINSTIDPDRHTVPMYFDLADLTIDEA